MNAGEDYIAWRGGMALKRGKAFARVLKIRERIVEIEVWGEGREEFLAYLNGVLEKLVEKQRLEREGLDIRLPEKYHSVDTIREIIKAVEDKTKPFAGMAWSDLLTKYKPLFDLAAKIADLIRLLMP
jgi:hypothetical protein